MPLSVAALVVSHQQPSYLRATLLALKQQSFQPGQAIVVETAADLESIAICNELGFEVITPGSLQLGAAFEAARVALREQPDWLWLLHDDSAPEPAALEQLSILAETSPSVAVVGPKLLQWDNPIQIQQFGLTATRTGRPFLQVKDEYDQGQHDSIRDSLAVSTAGMLVSSSIWQQLGGLDDSSPLYAQDVEFALKIRALGYRVALQPTAKVLHAGLAMAGRRSKSWQRGTLSQALSRAHLHLGTILLPAWLLPFLYLALPLAALVFIPYNLWAKQPGRTIGQLGGWLWAWGTLAKRLGARSSVRKLGSLVSARTFLATRTDVTRRRRSRLVEPADAPRQPGMLSSNQGWWALLPLAAAVPLWPSGAVIAERIAPLSQLSREVYQSVSALSLQRGFGLEAPSDPFNWFLAALAAISPTPSIGLAAFIGLGTLIAFIGAWKLARELGSSPGASSLVGLGHSLSPFALGAAYSADVVLLAASSVAPLAGLFLVKAARAFNLARAWRWIGLAGLALAALAVATPLGFAVAAMAVLLLAAVRPLRAGVLVWSLLPGTLLLLPWIQFWISRGQPEVALGTSWAAQQPLELGLNNSTVYLAIAVLLSIAGLLTPWRRWLPILGVGALGLTSVLVQPVANQHALNIALLAALILLALGLTRFRKTLRALSLPLLIGLILTQAVLAILPGPGFTFAQERQMPALVVAQAKALAAGVDPRKVHTMLLEVVDGQITAEPIWGDGLGLEEQGLASRFIAPELDSADYARLAGSLYAGNSAGVQQLLTTYGVDFVLLRVSDPTLAADLEVQISAMEFLQPAGISEFGMLWQTGVEPRLKLRAPEIDPIRTWQLLSLAAFALLAIPTPAAIRGSRRAKRGEQ